MYAGLNASCLFHLICMAFEYFGLLSHYVYINREYDNIELYQGIFKRCILLNNLNEQDCNKWWFFSKDSTQFKILTIISIISGIVLFLAFIIQLLRCCLSKSFVKIFLIILLILNCILLSGIIALLTYYALTQSSIEFSWSFWSLCSALFFNIVTTCFSFIKDKSKDTENFTLGQNPYINAYRTTINYDNMAYAL